MTPQGLWANGRYQRGLEAFSALDTISRPQVFSVGMVEDGLFDYDLGFGEQLILNTQVITSSNHTPRDFPKQTPLNPTFSASIEKALGLLI